MLSMHGSGCGGDSLLCTLNCATCSLDVQPLIIWQCLHEYSSSGKIHGELSCTATSHILADAQKHSAARSTESEKQTSISVCFRSAFFAFRSARRSAFPRWGPWAAKMVARSAASSSSWSAYLPFFFFSLPFWPRFCCCAPPFA